MSDSPNPPDAPGGGDGPKPAKPAKGIKGTLGKKVGPLPLGVWLLAIGGGLAIAVVMRRRAGGTPEGTVEEAGGFGWDEPDPGGTRPGIGGNAGQNGQGSDWSSDLDWIAPWPDLPSWQDPPEPTVPGTAGGAGTAQPNNGGPTGTVKHRYVPEGPNKPKCKVCGRWRDTAVHTNRDAPKKPAPQPQPPKPAPQPPKPAPQPSPPHTGVAPANPDEKHRWVPISDSQPRCKKCGRWRDTWVHSNR